MEQKNIHPTAQREQGIELLRFLSCCGIVIFHAGAPGARFGYGGLLVFMILSVVFTVSGTLELKNQISKNVRRIIIPWIFWSCIYALSIISRSLLTGKDVVSQFEYWMILTGPSLHLWYLPFVFIVLVLLSITKTRIQNISPNFGMYLWACVAGIFLVVTSLVFSHIPYVVPFTQWFFILASIPAGLFWRIMLDKKPREILLCKALWIYYACCIIALIVDWNNISPYFTAVIACSVIWIFRKLKYSIFIEPGKISYGIYLVHVLFLSLWGFTGVPGNSYILVLLVLVSSIITTYIIQKTKLRIFV